MKSKAEIINKFKELGFSNSASNHLGGKLYDEKYGIYKNLYSDEERKWAYSHGFTAEVMKACELNDENYQDYVSMWAWYALDPVDPFTKRIIDGKLIIPFSIGGKFPQYLPKYFCWVKGRNNLVLMKDNPISEYENLADYLIKLLDIEKVVAVKPYTGAGGIGFVKLEKCDDGYYSNGELIEDFDLFADSISDKYLITEYVKQIKAFDAIWKESTATARVVALNDPKNPEVFVSYIRFGTSISNTACNFTSGGVGVPFDWETGEMGGDFYQFARFSKRGYKLESHPDSKIRMVNEIIPRIGEMKKLVRDICGFLPVHMLFGFDIMITDTGVVLSEINSQPAMDIEQLMCGGLWTKNQKVTGFFRKLISEKGIEQYTPFDFMD